MKQPQTVYIPTKVEDELPKMQGYYKTVEEGSSYFDGNSWFEFYGSGKKCFPEHWLKPTEAFVFTSEELEQLLSDVFDSGKGIGIISYQPQGHTLDKELYDERKEEYIENILNK